MISSLHKCYMHTSGVQVTGLFTFNIFPEALQMKPRDRWIQGRALLPGMVIIYVAFLPSFKYIIYSFIVFARMLFFIPINCE